MRANNRSHSFQISLRKSDKIMDQVDSPERVEPAPLAHQNTLRSILSQVNEDNEDKSIQLQAAGVKVVYPEQESYIYADDILKEEEDEDDDDDDEFFDHQKDSSNEE